MLEDKGNLQGEGTESAQRIVEGSEKHPGVSRGPFSRPRRPRDLPTAFMIDYESDEAEAVLMCGNFDREEASLP